MICVVCLQDKARDEMHMDRRRRNPATDTCADCWAAKSLRRHTLDKQRHRRKDPAKVRAAYRTWQLKAHYGLTPEDVDAMLDRQNGCAICHSSHPNWTRAWHVDHDHTCCPKAPTCGQCVRGILCHKCNTMLGLAGDRKETLAAALTYLKGSALNAT